MIKPTMFKLPLPPRTVDPLTSAFSLHVRPGIVVIIIIIIIIIIVVVVIVITIIVVIIANFSAAALISVM